MRFELGPWAHSLAAPLIHNSYIIIEHEKQNYVIYRLSLGYYNVNVHLNFLIDIVNQEASR